MKVSIVTISYNQATFLERTIRSVLNQKDVDLEYIIVDPGSTDGSRNIIEKYRTSLAATVFERDAGPADGLNKGFARASGEIFCYLNSDDTLEPGALATAVGEFERDPELDVLCAHAWVIDEEDLRLRKVWSDTYNPRALAYGAAILIQPSTFFRAGRFRLVGGFNIKNCSNWDGELVIDMCKSGAKIKTIDAFLSNYRVHGESITGSGGDVSLLNAWRHRQFEKLIGREMQPRDRYIGYGWWVYRQLKNPAAFFERLLRGSVYGRKSVK